MTTKELLQINLDSSNHDGVTPSDKDSININNEYNATNIGVFSKHHSVHCPRD